MRVLTIYLSREFIKLFVICQVIFLFIYLIVDFTQKVDNFIGANVARSDIFAYFLYKAPYTMVQMTPIAMLLSTIIMLCVMAKNNEIIALKASGMSVVEISRPIISLSILIAIIVFLFSELVVPYASSKSYEIWNVKVNKRVQLSFYGRDQMWYKGKDSIYWIRKFNPEKNTMEEATFYFFDKSYRLQRRIDAKKGFWSGKVWKLQEGIIQKAIPRGGYNLEKFDEIDLRIPEEPEAFYRTVRKPAEMSYWQLKQYAARIQREGYDATRYLVDMNVKLAFPAISVIMVLMGIPIALGVKRGGTPLAVSIGISVCFLYLVVLGISRALGLAGVFPPIFSAWLANVIFFFLGVYLILNLES